jgi:hypothetical protein
MRAETLLKPLRIRLSKPVCTKNSLVDDAVGIVEFLLEFQSPFPILS